MASSTGVLDEGGSAPAPAPAVDDIAWVVSGLPTLEKPKAYRRNMWAAAAEEEGEGRGKVLEANEGGGCSGSWVDGVRPATARDEKRRPEGEKDDRTRNDEVDRTGRRYIAGRETKKEKVAADRSPAIIFFYDRVLPWRRALAHVSQLSVSR